MKTIIHSFTPRKISLITGVSLLLMAVTAGIGYGYAFENLYVANDGIATINNLSNHPHLLKIVLVSFATIIALDIVVATGVYVLFKHTDKFLALLTSTLRLIYTIILLVAVYYLSIVAKDKIVVHNAQAVMYNFTMFLKIWSFGLIFFGMHLCTLAFLFKKTIHGHWAMYVLLLIAGICYVITNVAEQLFPEYLLYKNRIDMFLALPMALGELAFAVWLLAKKNWRN